MQFKQTLLIAISGLAIFNLSSAIAAEIRVGGGAAPINNIFRRVKDAFERETNHKLILSEQGPDMALIDLDQGKLDLATAGLPQNDWIKLVEAKKYSLKNKDNFKVRTIGRDIIQVYVSADVGVAALSREQLKEIFTGKVTNWKSVGGSDAPVQVVFGTKIPGTNKVFEKEILGGEKWAPGMKEVETAPEIGKKIASLKGAIGIGPIGLDTKDVTIHSVRIPTIGRPILAATNGVPKHEILELFDFLLKNGKDYTKE